MLHDSGPVDSSILRATVVSAGTGCSIGDMRGGHGSWGSGDATGVGKCVGLVWQVLASSEGPDFFK